MLQEMLYRKHYSFLLALRVCEHPLSNNDCPPPLMVAIFYYINLIVNEIGGHRGSDWVLYHFTYFPLSISFAHTRKASAPNTQSFDFIVSNLGKLCIASRYISARETSFSSPFITTHPWISYNNSHHARYWQAAEYWKSFLYPNQVLLLLLFLGR